MVGMCCTDACSAWITTAVVMERGSTASCRASANDSSSSGACTDTLQDRNRARGLQDVWQATAGCTHGRSAMLPGMMSDPLQKLWVKESRSFAALSIRLLLSDPLHRRLEVGGDISSESRV